MIVGTFSMISITSNNILIILSCAIHTHANAQGSLHNISLTNSWVHYDICGTVLGRGIGMNITAHIQRDIQGESLVQHYLSNARVL